MADKVQKLGLERDYKQYLYFINKQGKWVKDLENPEAQEMKEMKEMREKQQQGTPDNK